MIYIASPYTHADKEVMVQRFMDVSRYAAELTARRKCCFCPISHSHPWTLFPEHDVPHDWDFWEKLDEPFMEICDEIHVLMLDGWDASRGVANEIRHFLIRCKPVVYIDPDK